MQLTAKKKITLFYIISVIFIALNGYFIAIENYYFTLFPIVLLILFFAIFALDKLIYLIVFLSPLSVPLKEIAPDIGFDMFLPTEPLLFGILILFVVKTLIERRYDRLMTSHPISIAIFLSIGWMLITSITSTMPAVSFKFLTARLWFLVSFYFIAAQLFKNKQNIQKYVWLYIIPLLGIIAYVIIRHSTKGFFDKEAPNWAVQPFFNDHTSYAASLAFVIPFVIGSAFLKRFSINIRILFWIVGIFILIGTVLSYTRAAWISLIGALLVLLIINLKIKFRYWLVLGVTIIGLLIFNWTDIMLKMEQNRQDSSTNLTEHVKSISNVASDASNLERINRWSCAIRMFNEKPFFGWGPGTYQFKYAPFQYSYEKTIISTNAGDMGNAHSEYLGPLSESGVPGTLFFLIIVILTVYTGIKVYKTAKDKEIRQLAVVLLLSLITYYLHAFLNNFLDTDKASALFWGFTAALAALDSYYPKNKERLAHFKRNII